MKPEIVTEAPMPPGQCLFSADQEGPWIDTGVLAPWVKPYGYISVSYAESLARDLLGMVSQDDVDAQVQPVLERLAEMEQEIEELRAFSDADQKAKELLQGASI